MAPVRFVGRQREDYAGNLFLGAREAGAAVTIVGKDRACMSSRGVWARLLSSAVVSKSPTRALLTVTFATNLECNFSAAPRSRGSLK